ncbi:MAG: hypothetical protein V2J10_11780 [Wenzhouxiangella sp.]|jgi:hypothetical protein|nr:hypothetical protein [Wenzhouxiangella sp.]
MSKDEELETDERVGRFEDARHWAEEDFRRKTPRQRLEWLESAQQLYRLGRQRADRLKVPESTRD